MLFQFGLRSSLLLIFFTHLCVYAFLFWKRGIQQERLSDRLLGTFFFLSALFIFPWMSGFAGWYDTQPYREILFYTPFIHAFFFGPLLYLYLKSLTNSSYRLSKKDLLHFLPGALYLLWCIVIVITDKLLIGHYYLMNGDTDPDFDAWYSWAWSASILIYLVLALRYYRQYIVFSGFEFSFADAASFKWLRNFLYTFTLLTILLISEHIVSLFIELFYVRSWYYFFAFALITYYMAISAYSAKPIIKLNFEPQLLTAYTEPLQLSAGAIDIPYEDQSWMEVWKVKVDELMVDRKVYLEPELTLTDLARKIGTNASLLSKVINGIYGKNFNDYVNEFRVQEAIRLLQTPGYQNFNLLAVAYDAGFNSKSTFNRAFKKVTGKSPKDHMHVQWGQIMFWSDRCSTSLHFWIMKKSLLILLCFCGLTATAQVSGKVTDEKGRSLPAAVVRLFTRAKISKTVLTDTSGNFSVQVINLDHLIITSVGYRPDTIYTAERSLGGIRLKLLVNQLNEVLIKSRQPLIRQETDRSIISVNEQVKQLAANGLELVNLAPGITISDNENAIIMSGKAEVQIMINDKVVKMTPRDLAKMLKAMPAGSIKQVEFLSNPPAKYDVNGNTGIINIKTNGVVKGLTGNLDYNTSQSTYNWSDLSGLLNYGSGKLAISGYGAWHSGGYLTDNFKVRQLNPGVLTQQTSSLDKWSDPVFRVAVDYGLTPNSTLGGIIEREASTNTGSYNTYSQQGANSFLTDSKNPYVRHWNTYNLNYRYSDTLGTELTIDLDRADFSKDGQISLVTSGQPPIGYSTLTGISIQTLKADYTRAWKNKLKLEAGLKIAQVRTDDSQDANIFHYNENIRALYVGLSGSNAHWGWQMGSRAEQTKAKGEAGGSVKPDTSYLNLLPSAYLTWAPAAAHQFRLSLSRRIKRPDYSDLQPFIYVQDPLSQRSGNPGLRTQRNDQAELTYTFDDRVTFVGTYSRATDYFSTVYRPSGNILIELPANNGVMQTVNFDLNYPVKLSKWWNMLNKVNFGNDHFEGDLFQGKLDQGKWRYQLSTSQRLNLPGKYLLQLSGRYTSASQNLIYYQQSSANASASISRKFLKEQASVRLGISDIFKTQRNYTSVNFGSLVYNDQGTFESRRVSLSFSWRFGNSKVRQTSERQAGNEDEKGRSGN